MNSGRVTGARAAGAKRCQNQSTQARPIASLLRVERRCEARAGNRILPTVDIAFDIALEIAIVDATALLRSQGSIDMAWQLTAAPYRGDS
jgi:hypothetical protein